MPQVEIVTDDRLTSPAFDAAWNRLRRKAPAATAFSSPAFSQAAASCLGFDLAAGVLWQDADNFAGGVLCYTRRVGPYTRVVVPPFVQYTPLLLSRVPSEHEVHGGASVFQGILQALGRRFGGVALNLLPEVRDLRPAVWSGFRVRPLYTYRIELGAGRPVQGAWSDNAMRLFRRHTDAFEIVGGIEHAEGVIELCAAGYARHGRRLPVPADRLLEMVRRLDRHDMVRVFALRSGEDGACEAGVVVLNDGAVAHYWIAGSRPGPAMTVLLGHLLQRLDEDGVSLFDFVGANTPSIAEFKRRFGPQLVPYHRVEATSVIGLKVLDLVRGRA